MSSLTEARASAPLQVHELSMGLQCVLGERDVLLPSESVEQVRSFEVSALPRARDHVGGVATCDDGLVMTLVLDGSSPSEGVRRSVLGALLVPFIGEPIRWAIEVSRVISLVTVVGIGPASVSEHPWFDEATTSAGVKIPWLRVERLLADCGVRMTKPAPRGRR